MTYKHNKAWRLSHTAKRNTERKRYYHKYPSYPDVAGKRWSIEDADLILTSKKSDVPLRVVLGRSIQAIQIKRCRLMKGEPI